MRKVKSIILLSGGLDSVVNTAFAARRTYPVLALTFDYGQRSAKEETRAARKVAKYYSIPHRTIRLPWLGEITRTSLVNRKRALPRFTASELNQRKKTLRSAAAVWVPNRNGAFINIAAAFAETLKADWIITGFNAEEAATFSDNSAEYVHRANRALLLSTLQRPRLKSFTQNMDKSRIVTVARRMRVPLHLAYSCYAGQRKMCGKCESCLRLLRALKSNG